MNAAGIAAVRGGASTDVELVEAVRAGEDAAFEELYRRHHPGVGRFVRSRVRDAGRAEDVAQDVFVSALRRLRETDAEIAFRPWIYEIARNASIDLYRRTSRTEEVSIDIEGGLAPADASRLAGGTAAVDATVLHRQSFENLRGALDELSATHHEIIIMRELEGRSYREIGERMELSPAAVESTLFRARRKLEHEYDQLDTGRRCRLVGAAIGRLAEGVDSDRDRKRLDRHAQRCSSCRRRARELGIEPLLRRSRRRVAARAAALLPAPGLLRRNPGEETLFGTGAQQGASSLAAVAPNADAIAGPVSKAVALIAAAACIGGGGATLGGTGPLSVPRDGERHGERSTAGQREASPPPPPATSRGSAPDARAKPAPRAPKGRGAPARGPGGRRPDLRSRSAPPPPARPSRPSAASPAPAGGSESAPKTVPGPAPRPAPAARPDAGGTSPALPRPALPLLPQSHPPPVSGITDAVPLTPTVEAVAKTSSSTLAVTAVGS